MGKFMISGQNKITPEHLKRSAYVYVRQSSLKQVLYNRESQENQYQLVERAESLGWQPDKVKVIDADQGLSGQSSENRNGFKELVAEVSMGQAGIVFGYEVSRLARNNSDWYHLLDLAAMFDTLIADIDGIYDLRMYNDRLLLGLKGTMSEAELHLIRQRLDAGRMNQVQRGSYEQRLPTGLTRLTSGKVVKDADDQIRHTVELVFAKFEELGSCMNVIRYLRRENILLPRYEDGRRGQEDLEWRPASDFMVGEMIKNPAYAGAFVYGRKQTDPIRRKMGQLRVRPVKRPMDKWIIIKPDVYPAYITWEQYLANQETLRQNLLHYDECSGQSRGHVRKGKALLSGMLVCGHCGYRMRVGYKPRVRYYCAAPKKRFGEKSCIIVNGQELEAAVVTAFFEALQPAQLDALEAVLDAQRKDHTRLLQHWQERLKRAQYEARLAERQYNGVDPDNRLVAAELERRWEEALRQLQDVRQEYDRFLQKPAVAELTPEMREQFRNISETLPDLWPTLPNEYKKELLRSLISEVVVKKIESGRHEVRIVWISGHHTTRQVWCKASRRRDLSAYEKLVERIHALWQAGMDDEQIAELLTKEGFRSARKEKVTPFIVYNIRLEHRWHSVMEQGRNSDEVQGYLTARGLAKKVGMSRCWIYNRILDGTIPPEYRTRHPQGHIHLIKDDPELIEKLQRLCKRNTSKVTGALS